MLTKVRHSLFTFPKLCRKKQNVPKCPSISSLIGVEFVLFHFSREVPTLIHFKEH